MFAKSQRTLFLTFIFLLLLGGCNARVSDSEIVNQVANYLKNDSRQGFMSTITFSEVFEVETLTVKDKLIKDKEMTVICNVAVRIKKNYQGGSGVNFAYDFIVGGGPGAVGETKANDVKFMFERYESGWRIIGESKES